MTLDPAGAKGDRRYDDIVKPKGSLYFFGVVRYVDGRGAEFGTEHLSVFRRVWDPKDASFHRTGDPDHEHSD
jgi:hypothetical protein